MTTKKVSIYQKLLEARQYIKEMNLKKTGKNTYSNYEYFTPEDIGNAVYKACQEVKAITIFNLKRLDNGYVGTLKLQDIDSEQSLVIEMATDIPSIKATNSTQQIGGAMTYTERYLKMTMFDIQDNTLDFDTSDNTKKVADVKKGVNAEDAKLVKECLDLDPSNKFVKDLGQKLKTYGQLTPAQRESLEDMLIDTELYDEALSF